MDFCDRCVYTDLTFNLQFVLENVGRIVYDNVMVFFSITYLWGKMLDMFRLRITCLDWSVFVHVGCCRSLEILVGF